MSDQAPRSLSVGTKEGRVVIGDNGKPIAAFTAPQAATLAALLIKHACIIASGYGPALVEEETSKIYGPGEKPVDPSTQ